MCVNTLKHYGIPGMKWGVRKFIERHDKGETHRDRLQNKYLELGYSKEEASNRADDRIRAEKVLAIAGGVALTAAVAFYAHHKYTTDEVISKNVKFQKIMLLPKDVKPSGNLNYMAFKKQDKKRYEGTYAQALLADKWRRGSDEQVKKLTTQFNRDIKIASPKRARDTFKDLYKKDSEFRKIVSKVSEIANAETESTKKQARAYKALDSLVKGKNKNFHGKAYDGFNVALAGKGETFDKLRSKYYEALAKQGVDAVIDRNDKSLSGYGTKKPVIMLRQIAARNSMRDMSTNEILAKGLREELKDAGRKYIKYMLATSAIATAATAKEEYDKQMSERKKKTLKNREVPHVK